MSAEAQCSICHEWIDKSELFYDVENIELMCKKCFGERMEEIFGPSRSWSDDTINYVENIADGTYGEFLMSEIKMFANKEK